MDWSQALNDVLKAALIASVPAFMALIGTAFGWLKAWLEANTKNQWLIIIEREAFEVVSALGQATVGPMKEAAKDGKLTPEEIRQVKDVAMAELQARLKNIPAHLFPDLIGRIGHAVESAVAQTKPANPQSPPASK